MAQQYIYNMYNLNKFYGQKQVLKDINLSYFPGVKIGIVGINGAGKSTLLRIMAGEDKEFRGMAEPAKDIKVSFVPQEPELVKGKTVRENLELAVSDTMNILKEYDEISAAMGEMNPDDMDKAIEKMGVLQDKIDACDGWEIDTKLNMASAALVLPPDDMLVDTLSGGEKRRVALCRALLEQPDLLLLDEPTNHLDAETISWLESYLRDYKGTVIISTHDRYFLDNITGWILELEDGEGTPFEGNYSSWLSQKLEFLASTEKKESSKRKSIEKELKWIKMNTNDHQEINRERLVSYEQLVAKETSEQTDDATVISIAPAAPLGEKVLKLENLTKGFDKISLIENLTLDLPRGAITGIIGPNGAGKTTLFNMITGSEKPDSGELELGESVEIACVEQFRDILDGEKTIHDELSEGNSDIDFGTLSIPSRAYCSKFGFRGSDQQKLVKNLSGGERNRLHLAKILKSGANLILLDEPTNDLDVNTLRMLEDAINGFSGCIMVISHDRFFLNRVCTHLLVFEGDSEVVFFNGNWEAYEAYLKKTGKKGSAENRRAKYRKFKLN